MAASAPHVHVAAEGQATATTRLWRFRGQLRVTVIVKATFALVHQGLMKLAPPDPLLTTDVHHGNSPVRSARLTPDLAPYLPATDVLLTGHAYAPAGERAAWVTAGIGILDGYEPILEKYLDVRGEMGPDGIQPFQKIPLVYERAFGGPGWEDNPFGVGAGGAKGEPNIFYIGDHRRSAGFGPYSIHWPARKKLVSPAVRKALSEPIAEIPEGFDWTYFHAAPRDQRCPFLTGSEWLVLQGLRPDERRVRTRLPAAKGRALVFWAGEAPEGEPLELLCDTLRIEPDRGVCSVNWRKSFAVAEESDLSDLRVLAGVELSGQPIVWSAQEAAAALSAGAVSTARAAQGTPGAGGHQRTAGAQQARAGAAEQGRAARAEQATATPPGSGRRARVPTVTLSDADLEVLSDADQGESAVLPGARGQGAWRPESEGERRPDRSELLVSPEGRAAVRALAGTVDLQDRDTAPDAEPPGHRMAAAAAAAGAPVSAGAAGIPLSAGAAGVQAVQTPGVPRPRAQTPAVQSPGVPRPRAQTPEAQTPVAQPPAVQSPGVPRPRAQTPEAQTPVAQTPAVQSPGVPRPRAQTPAVQTPVAQTPAVQTPAVRPLGMGPLGVRPPAEQGAGVAVAGAPGPMILGSFRLAVFSPDYEEAPDDPLLSTLVIRNKSSPGAEPLRTTIRMEETPPPDSEADMLQRTLVMKGRRPVPRPEPPAPVIQDKVDPLDIDDPSATTLVLRNKTSPGGADSAVHGRPLGDLSGPPESTTGVLGSRPMQPVPRSTPAGTIVIDDEDTEDTGPVPPELAPPNRRSS